MTYTLYASGLLVRDADGASIPQDTGNADYRAYQAWLAAGNTATAGTDAAPVLSATPYQLTLALNAQGSAAAAAFDAALVKAKPSDRIRWNARTDPMPADNPVLVRLCAIAGIDPVPLHALAVQQ